jgi:hypothetical protein
MRFDMTTTFPGCQDILQIRDCQGVHGRGSLVKLLISKASLPGGAGLAHLHGIDATHESLEMKKIAALALIALLPVAASAGIIIDNSTGGLYNNSLGDMQGSDISPSNFFLGPNVSEGDPTLSFLTQPAFITPAALGANWLSGVYNSNWHSVASIPGTWAVNEETAIVYDFSLASASNLHIDLGVDNGILLWLDGSYVFGAQAGGGSTLGEYAFDLPTLLAGNHRLQLIREDHGGSTGWRCSAWACWAWAWAWSAAAAATELQRIGLSKRGATGASFFVRRARARIP